MLVPLSAISIPPRRQRTTMDPVKLSDLKKSIREKGLLHPIVVRKVPSDNPELPPVFQLICGERRLTAWKELADDPLEGDQYNQIPVTLIDSLDKIQRREAELEENLLREDLSWQDRTKAIADLHALRQTQLEESIERGVDHGEGDEWTITDTAKEIAKVQDRPVDGVRKDVTRAMVVAKHLAAGNEVVKNARSAREAYDIISRQTEQDFTAALAKATGGKTEHIFMQGDMRELQWPDGLDCIVADPPYGIGADGFGNAGSTHLYEDNPSYAFEIYKFIAGRSYAMTKPSAHIYLFCDVMQFSAVRDILTAASWTVFRTPIIWFKGSQGFDPKPGIGFRRTYETLAFAWKGDRPAKALVNDVIGGVSGLPVGSSHAAAKPVELYRQLLARTCNPADRVLDPCCGSGTIFPAATQVGANAWGFELNEAYAKAAEARRFSKN